MHSSPVWVEYFYIFKLLWKQAYLFRNFLARYKGGMYTHERGVEQ